MNHTFAPFDNEKVRQAIAMGIDRQRIVDNFCRPAPRSPTHFTPCAIPYGCAGDAGTSSTPPRRRQLLAEAGFPDGFETMIQYRDVVRGYLPMPPSIAQDLQAQLKANSTSTSRSTTRSPATFIDNSNAGKLDGLHLLGWGADYPDVTNFLDYHFGAGRSPQFGTVRRHHRRARPRARQTPTTQPASRRTPRPTTRIKAHVPMVPIRTAAPPSPIGPTSQDAHISPLGNETSLSMTPGDRTQFVWMQNGEPPGLYCADESDGEALRACEQMTEGLYGYEIGGTAADPGAGTGCTPNAELTIWTCTLRDGRHVPRRRRRSTPTTSSSRSRPSGMPDTRSTRARQRRSPTSPACSVAS